MYKVAIIGRTGRGNYGHGLDTVWRDVPRTTVVAVADENDAGRAAAAQRTGAPRAYADYREMLDKERPQIVSVAPRWLDCHRDMVLAAVSYGCHVLLEKPMCRNLEEADEMVDACERAHVQLAICHQTRYSPRVAQIEALIRAGRLGDILELRGRGKEDRRGGGEDLMVLGTHIMDLMRLFAGDPVSCFAHVLENGKPVTPNEVRDGAEGIGPLAGDEIHALYRFQSPTVATFSTHRARHGAAQRFGLHILGSRGAVTLRTGSLPAAHFIEDPSWSPGRSGAEWIPITSAGLGAPEPLADGGLHMGNVLIAKDLIASIEDGRRPRGSVYDGRAALEMILATYASHRADAPVRLPLAERRHPLGRSSG